MHVSLYYNYNITVRKSIYMHVSILNTEVQSYNLTESYKVSQLSLHHYDTASIGIYTTD